MDSEYPSSDIGDANTPETPARNAENQSQDLTVHAV